MSKYYDISPLISAETAVFPGDTPFSRRVMLSFEQGHNLLLSSIQTTVHIGAHADAPNHYHPDGVDIASRDLRRYFGRCQVITVKPGAGARIYPEHLGQLQLTAPRVLFRTESYPNPNQWNDDFSSLSPELIQWLKARDVVLVGIDTPSIDPHDSKALESHQAVYGADMAVLEGVVLDDVPDGVYLLSALPLKLAHADASPVRAVLFTDMI